MRKAIIIGPFASCEYSGKDCIGKEVYVIGQSDGGATLNTGGIAFLCQREDGSVFNVQDIHVQFIDSPRDEQRAEFAKAAMQGMISNSTYTSNIAKTNAGEFVKILTMESVEVADALIAELKKQKP